MIEAQNLTKDYGTIVAVRGVSFTVGRGEIVGFLGPNGAGKSTTLRMLAGFIGPTSGTVRIDGFDIQQKPREAKRRIGYMPEASPLYPEMRVREYLEFRAALKGVARSARRAAIRTAMERAAIAEVAETVVQHLSKGYRQRVGLADALLASPPLLILDEPTAGLDPNQIREVRKLIRDLGGTHTILLSTHILSEVEATCDRAIVIDRGKLVAEGKLSELVAAKPSLSAVVRDPEHKARAIADGVDGVLSVSADFVADSPELVRLTLGVSRDPDSVAEELVEKLVSSSVRVRSIVSTRPSLEEVFGALTRDDAETSAEVEGRAPTVPESAA